MFVDLMNDIYSTFTERFLKVQLVFDQPGGDGAGNVGGVGPGNGGPTGRGPSKPSKRYNAFGILEDVPSEEEQGTNGDGGRKGSGAVLDIAPDEPPKKEVVTRRDPVVVGAGRTRSVTGPPVPANVDWSNVGRNDPCPCGSGKKFKKCHGATL